MTTSNIKANIQCDIHKVWETVLACALTENMLKCPQKPMEDSRKGPL